MKIKELMSISGTPGLYRLLATKSSGVVGESLETGQKKFFSARSYQFSPLESIAIYTHDDALPLEEVFVNMKSNPPADNLEKSDMRGYFEQILPDHDQSKVYVSDINKIVNGFNYLHANGYLEDEAEVEDELEDKVAVPVEGEESEEE